jgi:hypothetical protein
MGEINAYKIQVDKHERKQALETPKGRRRKNTTTDLAKIEEEGVE